MRGAKRDFGLAARRQTRQLCMVDADAGVVIQQGIIQQAVVQPKYAPVVAVH
mgnify:CR=1 FL=1